MAVTKRPKGSNSGKSPPIFSHEFIIQNHADILSCVAMLLAVGLMFQVTSPLASLFVTLQHNITTGNETEGIPEMTMYTYGPKDLFNICFYTLIVIVLHAVIQEYIFDKLNRRMHLSKVKHSKFNESGQLLVFYAASAAWGLDIIIRENYVTNITSLWESYPHVYLPSIVKFYYIAQLAYWLHAYPELYFQKAKKDEIWAQVQYITMYLVFIAVGYVLNMTRLALVLLVLHYAVEFIFHTSRLLYFSEKTDLANVGFSVWNLLFVLVRLSTVTLSVLTFWYGLSKSTSNTISFAEGNFNTSLVRVNCLVAIFLLQAWVMWNFITFHLRRAREKRAESNSLTATKKSVTPKSPKSKKNKGGHDNNESRQDSDEAVETIQNGSPSGGKTKQRAVPDKIHSQNVSPSGSKTRQRAVSAKSP